MSSSQRYLPIVNAPIVISKELQEYFDFYNTLDLKIEESGHENLYAFLYMEKKKIIREEYLKSQDKDPVVPKKELDGYYFDGQKAFRLSLVYQLENTSYRGLHLFLASNIFLQKFCGLCNLSKIIIPSKSQLHEYINFLTEDELKQVFKHGLQEIFSSDSHYHPGDLYGDATCIKANMHYPVDWVFIIDGVRTMMKAVRLIRNQDIKNRMDEPEKFISQMNSLSVEMSAASRTKDAKKKRKAVLRKMKSLEKVIRQHVAKHLDQFKQRWDHTKYTKGRADVIINRLADIITLMPTIIKQAHERIIGGRLVPNNEKVLSIYQDNVHVITRKKAVSENEFGNQLLLVEQADGFIVDYIFNKEKIQHDSQLVSGIVERFKERFSCAPESFCSDRGFSSKTNSKLLVKEGIFDAMCPKSVPELQERMKDETFRKKIKRRGPNEGCIAIFKSKFSNLAKRVSGFTNRHKAVLWGLIAHNLFQWVNLTIRNQEYAETG